MSATMSPVGAVDQLDFPSIEFLSNEVVTNVNVLMSLARPLNCDGYSSRLAVFHESSWFFRAVAEFCNHPHSLLSCTGVRRGLCTLPLIWIGQNFTVSDSSTTLVLQQSGIDTQMWISKDD